MRFVQSFNCNGTVVDDKAGAVSGHEAGVVFVKLHCYSIFRSFSFKEISVVMYKSFLRTKTYAPRMRCVSSVL